MTTNTTTLPLKQGRWDLDTAHSSAGFAIRHLGISKVRGRFTRLDAALHVGATPADISITATVDIASIDTGNADRDAHVLAPDMLDVERRPTMAFRSTRVSGEGDEWSMEGELTIGEATRPVTLEVEFGGAEDSVVDERRHAGFEARGSIRRSDFGLDFGHGMLGDTVQIVLDVQFLEPR
ncbi:YceI family protein [Spirillospora sp. NPDC029432]|uniref:YceI family protein n=1 Tax=Spirillospora sp. NPDC029432 TaxID=3154599 RepID=UPI0034511248